MVRLTIPLIFILAIEVYTIYLAYQHKGYLRIISISLILIYSLLQVVGVPMQESDSLYPLNTRVVNSARKYFIKNKAKFNKFSSIYIYDKKIAPLNGSIEFKNILDDQNAIPVIFPKNSTIKHIYYGFETKIRPINSYAVSSITILRTQ